MSDEKLNKKQEELSSDADMAARPRRTYSPPKVLSAELLEAAAATCSQTGPGPGKMFPGPCSSLGS